MASALAFTVYSCGGNDSETQSTGPAAPSVTYVGHVWLDNETRSAEPTQTYARASFDRSAEPISPRFFELLKVMNNTPQTEACVIEDDEVDPVANSEEQALLAEVLALSPKEDALESIGAGENVTIMTPEGPWPSLVQEVGAYSGYQTGREEYKPGAIGDGSTVSFSGGLFPAMSDVPLATVAPILDLAASVSPAHRLKTGDAVTWRNNRTTTGEYAVLNLRIGQLTLAENGYSINSKQLLRCTVADTGRFDLPPVLNTVLSKPELSVVGITLTRKKQTTYQQGNALLALGAFAKSAIAPVE